jgi:hypothetical protein
MAYQSYAVQRASLTMFFDEISYYKARKGIALFHAVVCRVFRAASHV